jgi:hypothetical protein
MEAAGWRVNLIVAYMYKSSETIGLRGFPSSLPKVYLK